MLDVLSARGLDLRIIAEVIIAIGQSQSTLHRLRDDLGRVFEILRCAEAKHCGDPVSMKATNLVLQATEIANLIDSLQLRLEWPDSLCFNLLFVHAGAVIVGDLLFVTFRQNFFLQKAFENLVEHLEVLFVELGETPPNRIGAGNRIPGHPAAVRELIEVLASAGVAIDVGEIKTRDHRLLWRLSEDLDRVGIGWRQGRMTGTPNQK